MRKKIKKVSVIVPIYNQEKHLNTCIKSLMEQSYNYLEILLIDDGSTDESCNICKNYVCENIKYYYLENSGVSCARNYGILHAAGEYVLFVDCDDIVDKNYVEIMVKYIENERCDLCVCNYTSTIQELSNNVNNFIKYSKEDCFYNLSRNKKFGGYVWNKIYKKDILDNNNILFNNNIHSCEDFLFNAEYFKYIKSACYIDSNLYYYNLSNLESISTYNKIFSPKKMTILYAYKEIIKIYEKFSINNLIYIYINYIKILYYLYFICPKNQKKTIKSEIKSVWLLIKNDKSISIKEKSFLEIRKTFPYLTEFLRYKIKG